MPQTAACAITTAKPDRSTARRLLGVYKKPYLPSGAPANDDRITNVILHGRGNMPAVGAALAPGDIPAILAYLKTL